MALTIRTNNVPRDVIYGYELNVDERAEFDYIDWAAVENLETSPEFFRYKGQLYDLGEFSVANEVTSHVELSGWDGFLSDSFFSGIAIKFPREKPSRWNRHPEPDWEHVIVALVIS